MPVDVLAMLWFDVEDFVTPESDDILLRIAELMDKHGIRVTFKLVGEKLRALRRRGRRDVIEAISRHDIGFHSNYHSVHPTISEYIGDLGWDEGSSEFEKREASGIEEVRKVFHRNPSCYGHPGLCWAPQAYPVLSSWGVTSYVDKTYTILPINDRPFYYCNILNIMCLGQNMMSMDASGGPNNLPDDYLSNLGDKFEGVYRSLESSRDIGIISMACHPTTYVTEEFWDKINYANGFNPPEERIRKPKLKPARQVELDLVNFEKFVERAKTLPRLRFITASDAREIYRDKAFGRRFTGSEIATLSQRTRRSVTYQRISQGVWVSPAEIFALVVGSLARYAESQRLPRSMRCLHPLGPKVARGTRLRQRTVSLQRFLEMCSAVYEDVKSEGYLPNAVSVGVNQIAPADVLATSCAVYLMLARNVIPRRLRIHRGQFALSKQISGKGARVDWSRTYTNPAGFEAPRQTELARLQAWTLKPAAADLTCLRNPNQERSDRKK